MMFHLLLKVHNNNSPANRSHSLSDSLVTQAPDSYSLHHYLSTDKLSGSRKCFAASLTYISELKSHKEAMKHIEWQNDMKQELRL